MPKLYRGLAAAFAGALVLATVAVPASAQPRPLGPTAPSCPTTTVTDTTPTVGIGWIYRTTHKVCGRLLDGYDCLQVDRVNPGAVPPVVNLLPETCLHTRLR